jgi:hypothetical protein
MFDEDEDVIKEEIEDDYLPNQLNNTEDEKDEDEAAYLDTVYDGNPEPKNFKEAQNSPDFKNWWEAMCIEFRNMKHKQVWEITPNTSVPTRRKIIGSFWVLAQKDDGRYGVRCIAKSFSQILGKDFQ